MKTIELAVDVSWGPKPTEKELMNALIRFCDNANSKMYECSGISFSNLRVSEKIPTLTLASGTKVPEYILCEKCGSHLHISPNTKGAFSYQGCDCHLPEEMRID